MKRSTDASGKARGIRFRYAPDALSTRMYATLPEMIEGWTKNLALLFPRPLALALWRMLDLVLYFGIPVFALDCRTWWNGSAGRCWCCGCGRSGGFMRGWHGRTSRWWTAPLSILGVPLFVYLLVRSFVQHRVNKAVRWKGRSYATRG